MERHIEQQIVKSTHCQTGGRGRDGQWLKARDWSNEDSHIEAFNREVHSEDEGLKEKKLTKEMLFLCYLPFNS